MNADSDSSHLGASAAEQGSPAEEFEDLPSIPAQRRVALWDLAHPEHAGQVRGIPALVRLGVATTTRQATFEANYRRNFR